MGNSTQHKKKTDYNKFLMGIAAVMAEHNVKNVLIVSVVNSEIRNTCLAAGEENEVLNFLSDGMDAWIKQAQNN